MSHDTKKEGINVEFWLGQIFTLVATVFGVYLAANSGFSKALEFDALQLERDSYFVQRALYSEFEDNLDSVVGWTDEFMLEPRTNNMYLEKDKYQFSFFLWETVQEGSTIFTIPYSRVEVIADFYSEASHLRETMFSGNPFASPQAAEKLIELEKALRSEFLDDFEKSLEEVKKGLEENGLSL